MVTRAKMSVEEEEQAAKACLLPELRRHLELATRMYNVIWRVLASFDDTNLRDLSIPLRVRQVLLARLADDLRAVGHLCVLGYGVQACTVAASIFEIAHMIVFIGNDKGRANEWTRHNDPVHSFKNTREMVQENFRSLGSPDPNANYRHEYDVYTQLCWMKHANPMIQEYRDPRFWDLHGMLNYAPDTTENGIRRSWLGLQNASRLAMLGTHEFVKHDLTGQDLSWVSEEMRSCAEIERNLNHEAIERWGSERPFEDLWK